MGLPNKKTGLTTVAAFPDLQELPCCSQPPSCHCWAGCRHVQMLTLVHVVLPAQAAHPTPLP